MKEKSPYIKKSPYIELIVMAITLLVICVLGYFVLMEIFHDPFQPIELRINTSSDGPEMQKVTKMIQESVKQ